MGFITKYNASRIVKNIDTNLPIPISHDYYKRPIGILSDEDIKRLLVYKLLLSMTDQFIDYYYNKIVDNFYYIFRSNPAFHLDHNCEKLHADFYNIKVPKIIRDRGTQTLEEFRTWAELHKDLFEKDIEVFIFRLATRFNIPVKELEAVYKKNSGIEFKKNYDLEELDSIIEDILRRAKEYYYSSDKNRRIITLFRNKMYLRKDEYYIRFNNSGYSNEEVKEVLNHCYYEFIEQLIYYLQEWLRVSLNPDLSFEGALLEQIGFTNCKTCYSDYVSKYPPQISLVARNPRDEYDLFIEEVEVDWIETFADIEF